MKKSRFTEEQMIGALQRLDGGLPAKDVARDLGVNIQTLYRWASRGCRGVVLETVVVGGRRCTSPRAVQAFVRSLTSRRGEEDVGSLEPMGVARQTVAVLQEAGIASLGLEDSGSPPRNQRAGE